MRPELPILLLLSLAAPGCQAPADGPAADPEVVEEATNASWRQWGGPRGDFQVAGVDLAANWPEGGPPELWSRALGKGYSAVTADAGVLYTMYRRGDDEIAVALDAATGDTIWEHAYTAKTRKENAVQFGEGPNATPLILDDRIVTLGYTGMLHCLSRDDGAVLWSHDLILDHGGELLTFGYSASPMLHDGQVIVLAGGEQGAMALDPDDGSVIWKSAAGTVSYATPMAIEVDGTEQIIFFTADAIVGVAAGDGTELWSHPVVNQYENNSTGAIWGEDNLLWVPTQMDGGTRVLRLSSDGQTTTAEEVWSSNKISIHFWNSVRLGDHVFGSIGGNASILAAIDIRTGEVAWRERGFQQANLIAAGDQTVLLDETGQLALLHLSPDGVSIGAQAKIIDEQAWTTPTLVGTTLYVRDQSDIRALDLGIQRSG